MTATPPAGRPGRGGPRAANPGPAPLQALGETLLGQTGHSRRPGSGGPGRSDAAPAGPGRASSPDAKSKPTRERILDVALDLFTEHGYDQTSLREIAEHLGFTKAALYYHFASKDEIFIALHMRLHELTAGSIGLLTDETVTIETWAELLDSFIEQIPANRKLIAMHASNRTAFGKIHQVGHAQEHEDLDEKLRNALTDPVIPLADRIRMGCAFAAVMGGLVFGGETFGDANPDQLIAEMKSAIHDLLGRPLGPGKLP